MAIVQNPITGRSSGTYAGAVFATQFGKNILRSKPVSVSVSQSDASKLARQKFKALAAAVKELSPALNTFFTSKDFNMPVSSYIIGQAYDRAVSGTLNNVVIDYDEIVPAPDSLQLGDNITLEVSAQALDIILDQPAFKNIIGEDNKINIAVYNVTTGRLVTVLQDQEAGLTTKSVDSTLIGVADTLHVFVKPKKRVPFKPGSDLCVVVA